MQLSRNYCISFTDNLSAGHLGISGLPHLWIKKSDGGLGASPPAGVKGAAPRRMSSFLN